jgi:hypothetical protein
MGKQAGYLPPVQSVKEQVMNGTLLASGESMRRIESMSSQEPNRDKL